MSLLDPRLKAFLAIVESGTVHAAAKRLRLTQTGVTQRIRSLEKQLSVTFFTRSRSGMKPTHEGEALYRYCQATLETEGALLGEISGADSQAMINLTLAGPTSIVSARIVPSCISFYAKFPNVRLNFRLDDQENRSELLKKGIVQLAILSPSEVVPEMDSKMLRPDKYILVVSSKWKSRSTSDIVKSERIIDFYESDNTTKNYLQKFDLLEKARTDRIFANTNFALISLLKEGVGYGTLTQEVAAIELERGNLIAINQKQVFEDPQALAWYPRKEMPGYFSEIIGRIK